MSTRAQQILIVTIGLVGAVVMVFLGLWQAQVFVDKGNQTVEDRAAQPPVAFADYLDGQPPLGDIYGKRVVIEGRYVAGPQLLVPTNGQYRVLAAFEVADGRVLPVVRGSVAQPDAVPAAPEGVRQETGLFLPGEGDSPTPAPAGMLGSVRMPLVPQYWHQPLVAGFVTLSEADAAAHGLAPASVDLPQGEGSLQNGGYALQWWVFAAFGLGMAIKFAHGLGVRERRREDAALAAADATTEPDPESPNRNEGEPVR